jgi:hypothetical protein
MNIELKDCKIHGNTEFVRRVDGYQRCKKCSVASVAKRRTLLKEKAVEYKGGSCVKCGYNKCVNALHFHHLDSNKKDFGISGKTISWDSIKQEIDKCILVCANCHAEIHSE